MEFIREKSIHINREPGQAVFKCMEYAYSVTLVQTAIDSDKLAVSVGMLRLQWNEPTCPDFQAKLRTQVHFQACFTYFLPSAAFPANSVSSSTSRLLKRGLMSNLILNSHWILAYWLQRAKLWSTFMMLCAVDWDLLSAWETLGGSRASTARHVPSASMQSSRRDMGGKREQEQIIFGAVPRWEVSEQP